jgi:hypothetical protein
MVSRLIYVATPMKGLLAAPAAAVLVAVAAGCGADTEERAGERTIPQVPPPRNEAPAKARGRRGHSEGPLPGGNTQAQIATYRLEVQAALDEYTAAQDETFQAIDEAATPEAFIAALQQLEGSTAQVTARLKHAEVPTRAAAAHTRFVRAFSNLEASLKAALEARSQANPRKLEKLGERLAEGEFSDQITRTARAVDGALRRPAGA